MERCAGELVSEMLHVVEKCDPEEGEMRLIMSLFPLFTDLYKQIEAADQEYAIQAIDHFRSFIQGPPNRPTKDPFGYLGVVLGFMDDLDEGMGKNDYNI